MSLRLEFDSPKRYRPKVGEIFLMKTTVGYVPVGVTSTKAFFGNSVMLHPYRALIHDITDTSYYPLVEKNELLIPPVMIPKPYFRKEGCFIKCPNKNTPSPIPFDKYFYYSNAMAWNPEEQGFAPAQTPFPNDRLPEFYPIDERTIMFVPHDSNPPTFETVDEAPPGTYFMDGYGTVITSQLEFAIEDTLAYYGLVSTPRPPHADFSIDLEPTPTQAESTKPMTTTDQFLRLVDTEGATSLLANMDQTPDEVNEVISNAGHEPNGYFFEGLATYLISQHNLDDSGIDADSEGSMFCFYGDRAPLEQLRGFMLNVLNNPTELAAIIEQAEESGHDFDD